MIKNINHRRLKELFETGSSNRIGTKYKKRAIRILDALNVAVKPKELDIPGFDFHKLKNTNPVRYSTHVNGNYVITFGWDGDNAINVNFGDYH
jgi:proteic killer suppression protein